MPARPALPDLVGLRGRRDAWLIGAGGKTTLMFALARALVAEGASAVTTTSTRIGLPGPEASPCVVLAGEPAEVLAGVRRARATHAHVTVAAGVVAGEDKLRGLPVATLELLAAADLATHVLVEADGAAGRPFKAHAAHEPVVSPAASLVIAVVGAGAVGAPLDDAHVHRAALACERLGLAAGARLAPSDIARLVVHPEGWLARVSPHSEVTVCVAAPAGGARSGQEAALVAALRAADRAGRLARVVAWTRRGQA